MALVARFAPPLALMGLIFFFSAQENLSTGLGTWDLIGRKIVHMAEYALLWFLWWRALGIRNPLPAAAIAVGYAATDEVHQSFVEGRHGTPVDVAIDAAGVALAITFMTRRRSHAAAP
jgi:VanZ family protein